MPTTQAKSNPFRYSMLEPYNSGTCVYKLWFGKHYIVLKCLRLHQSLQNFSVQIDRDLRNGVKAGSMLTNVIKHIHRSRVIVMTAQVVLMTDDYYELLLKERELLHAGKEDPMCLNYYFDVTFPKWIPQEVIDRYQAFIVGLAREKAKKTIAAKEKKLKRKEKRLEKKNTEAGVAGDTAGTRRRGRPPGSRNKLKDEATAPVPSAGKRRGRPPGSNNKAKVEALSVKTGKIKANPKKKPANAQ